jgi:hypothetical protein
MLASPRTGRLTATKAEERIWQREFSIIQELVIG